MPQGPGKYDDAATSARDQTKAAGVILIVVGGHHGDGFSAHLTPEMTLRMPAMLRVVADQIERDVNGDVATHRTITLRFADMATDLVKVLRRPNLDPVMFELAVLDLQRLATTLRASVGE